MHWSRRNAVGLLGLALAAVALAFGAEAYRTALWRDEQARAIPRRLERGETDLAEQHRKGVVVLSELADALRPSTYYVAAAAVAVALWDARRRQTSLWLAGATAALAAGAVALALKSRA